MSESMPAASRGHGASDDAPEVPWAMLPFAEALPRGVDVSEFLQTYGRAVHLHDLIVRLLGVNPNEARRLLSQGLVSLDGQVLQAWTADFKPGSRLLIRKDTFRIGQMEAPQT